MPAKACGLKNDYLNRFNLSIDIIFCNLLYKTQSIYLSHYQQRQRKYSKKLGALSKTIALSL